MCPFQYLLSGSFLTYDLIYDTLIENTYKVSYSICDKFNYSQDEVLCLVFSNVSPVDIGDKYVFQVRQNDSYGLNCALLQTHILKPYYLEIGLLGGN